MADIKISELTELSATPASDDYVAVVDTSATATKKVSADNLTGSKADKVSGATNGNFAGLDANGNLTDSGNKDADYADASHNNTAHSETYIKSTDVTFETLNTNDDVGTGASQLAEGDHTHVNTDVTDFDEAAQDAVGGVLADTATIDFTYTDETPEITADVIPGGIKLDDLGTPDDNTDLNVSITAHGLVPKAPNVAGQYLNGTGAWATPAGAGDVTGPGSSVSGNIATYGDTSGTLLADSGYAPTDFAVAAEGVTNGDSHNHIDGDGASLTEGALSLSDVTTANASTDQHGLLKKLSGTSTQYLDGSGSWSIPGGTSTKYLMIMANDMWPTTTAGCAALAQIEMATNKQSFKVLAFDKDTDENAEFSIVMPDDWDAGTVTAQFFWTISSSATGNAVWGIRGISYGDNGILDDTFGDAVEVTDGRNGVGKLNISSESGAVTIAGATAGELVQFRVYRNADDGGDTLTVDAQLVGIKITYSLT